MPLLPPRFLARAARYAISLGAPIPKLGTRLITHLANRSPQNPRVRIVTPRRQHPVQALAA